VLLVRAVVRDCCHRGFNKLYDDDIYIPGDLSFDPLGLYPTDPQEQYDLKVGFQILIV
jgi:hypothetical protein